MKPALALLLGLGTTDLVALHTLITPRLLATTGAAVVATAAIPARPSPSPSPSPSAVPLDREHPAAVAVAASPSPPAPPAPAPLYFAFDRATIYPVAAAELDRIGTVLAANPELALVITAHACAAGSDGHNLSLSERRARRVIEHLVARGIPAERLRPRARGERDAHGDHPDDRRDRRVDLAFEARP